MALATVCLGGCYQIGLTSAMVSADINKPRDPISVRLRNGSSWNMLMPLTPAPFHVGQSRAEAEALLAKSGYVHADQSFRPRAVPARAEIYRRDEKGPPCAIDHEVYVVFASDDLLAVASGVSYEAGCL